MSQTVTGQSLGPSVIKMGIRHPRTKEKKSLYWVSSSRARWWVSPIRYFFPWPQWPASAFSPSLSSPNDQDSVNSKERCRTVTWVEFPSQQPLQIMLTNAPSTEILKFTTGHENRKKWSSMTTVIRISLGCYPGCAQTLGNKTWTCWPGTSKSHFPQSSVSIAV